MNIIILGGSGGIGSCLTHELSKNHNLYISSTNDGKLTNILSDLKKYNVSGEKFSYTNFESMELFLNNAKSYLGEIDCIINCIGSLLLKPPHVTKEAELENVFKANVFSCFSVLKHGFKFLKQKGGSVIFFSSAASKVGLRNHESISAAKAAVSSIALSAASTYSNYNIRVNVIAPGLVETPLTSKITNNATSLEYSKKLHGLNKIGKPENFIPIVKALIDKKSDWISGQTFLIDGGLSNLKN